MQQASFCHARVSTCRVLENYKGLWEVVTGDYCHELS